MLSVIVPVYQVVGTLKRCVDSIVSQSLPDWELLLIDDGSTDGSSQICDELADSNDRIQVFHQQNAGLSEARNSGIALARGEYITFVDSDDFLLPDTLAPLYAQLSSHPEYDVLEYSLVKCSAERQEKVILKDAVYTNPKEYWLSGRGYEHTYACNKIFKRTLFRSLTFPRGKVFEDAWFMPQLLLKSPIICTSSLVGYNYAWNPCGITSKASLQQKRQLLQAQLKAVELLGITFAQSEGNTITDRRVGRLYLQLLNLQITACSGEDKTLHLPYQHVSPFLATSLKTLVKILILNVLGIRKLCDILN